MLEVMVLLEDNQLLKEYELLEVTFREEVLMHSRRTFCQQIGEPSRRHRPQPRSVTTRSRDSRAWL